MSMVRFAMICDHCGKRSPEYTLWPTCRECGEDVCHECSTDFSDDETNRATCLNCIKEMVK